MPRGGVEQGAGAQVAVRVTAGFLSLALAPWAFRVVALVDAGRKLGLADARGFAADAAVAAVLLAALWPLARLARWLAVLPVGVLALAYYGNLETILALGAIASPMDAGYVTDPTFFGGSVLAAAHPALLAAVLLASLVLAWLGLGRGGGRVAFTALAAGVVGLVLVEAWPQDPRFTDWRQVSAITHNVKWLARGGLAPVEDTEEAGFPDPPTAMLDLVPGLAGDLDAPVRFPFDGKGKNVLLVMMEGVSGYYVPAAAEFHRQHSARPMHNLDQAFRENVGFATYIDQQRRTNRGLYATLCGEPPRLLSGMPKMTVAAGGGWRVCLPEVLREAGYHTVYLQAAPLGFMLKDRFLPTAGFGRVLGQQFFHHHYLRTKWGVDDKAFFEQASRLIDQLQAGEKPWFLTLLTVGSHHPFVVPASFGAGRGTPMQRAFLYLDTALGEFLQRLERAGVRKDTLIVLTSDESSGDMGTAADVFSGHMSQNWGIGVAMLPERTREFVREPYAQQDMALSLLDYLGLADRGRHFFGRSLFRNYATPRPLFFSNLNFHTISGLSAQGLLVHCRDEGAECDGYAAYDGRLFAPALEPVKPDPAFVETVRELALRSRPPSRDSPFAIPLINDPVFTVSSTSWQMIQGVVEISLEPTDWLEVEFEAEVRGDGAVELHHGLRFSPRRYLMQTTSHIEPGQTVRLRYTLASDEPIPYVSVRTQAKLTSGHSADLVFKRRRFVLRRHGERPPAGARIEVFTLDPPSADPDALVRKVEPLESFAGYLHDLAVHGIGAMGEEEEEGEGL